MLSDRMLTDEKDLQGYSGIEREYLETINTFASEVRKLEVVKQRYYELIYAVATVFSDETRHETALRYIQEKEEGGPTDGEMVKADLEKKVNENPPN